MTKIVDKTCAYLIYKMNSGPMCNFSYSDYTILLVLAELNEHLLSKQRKSQRENA